MTAPIVRCAIYTRKSSDEGLEQEFNSLDAQAEACAAYIASQRHEGWREVRERFADGGISGGTLERPALQRLLAEIDAGRIDMVVVYKIDRLTRSLADFARLVERLEARGCSFVSVTQAFNTSSSMGRLTLNVLLSFAQFEREVTAERIRDKIAASKKKGLWMGGLPPLGYDPHPDRTRRELAINEEAATVVRRLFHLYAEHKNLAAVAGFADQEGLRSKRHQFSSGRAQGGGSLSRGQIHKILTNPVYRGLIRHKDRLYQGVHPAIIDEALWESVQTLLQSASGKRRGKQGGGHAGESHDTAAPLKGKCFDETGDLLTPSHTVKSGRRIRYYVSNRLVSGGTDPSGWRLPAKTLEGALHSAVRSHLQRAAQAHRVSSARSANEALCASEAVMAFVNDRAEASQTANLVERVDVSANELKVALSRDAVAEATGLEGPRIDLALLHFVAPIQRRRRGVESQGISPLPPMRR